MHNLPKIKKKLYFYDVKDPVIFNSEVLKDDHLKMVNAYLEDHYNVVAPKQNAKAMAQVLGVMGITKLYSKNQAKAIELLFKQLKTAEEKKVELEILKSVNNLGVILHRTGDIHHSYLALVNAARLRAQNRSEFISEIYNLANLLEELGHNEAALKLYTYCYRWYYTRIPLNRFRIVKILLSIMDIYFQTNRLEEVEEIMDKIVTYLRSLLVIKNSHPSIIENIFTEVVVTETKDESKSGNKNIFERFKNIFKKS